MIEKVSTLFKPDYSTEQQRYELERLFSPAQAHSIGMTQLVVQDLCNKINELIDELVKIKHTHRTND